MPEEPASVLTQRGGEPITGRQLRDAGRVTVVLVPGVGMGTGLTPLLPTSVTYQTYRTMRKNPTIAFGRALASAPIVTAEWTLEADDDVSDDVIRFIDRQIMLHRREYVRRAVLGANDFGWQPFEVVFAIEGAEFVLRKIKPLLHDLTGILIDKATGAFVGFWQEEARVMVPPPFTLLVSFDVEGTDWYGQSRLENSRLAYNEWVLANAGAARYDKKMAGSYWIIDYPVGTSAVDGTDTDNAVIVKNLIAALQSSGGIGVPRTDEMEWKIDLKSDASARQFSFVPRLEYLDRQMLRGILIPERAGIEGRFGTKAEAETHADVAFIIMELTHEGITTEFNNTVVNVLLEQNFGPEMVGKVRAQTVPITDLKQDILRDIYKAILSNPQGFAEEFPWIDTDSMKDILGIPKSEEVAAAGVLPEGVEPDEELARTIREIYAEHQRS